MPDPALQLHFENPDGELESHHLTAGQRYRLGRGTQCEIRILDLKMSRQHCAIEHVQGVWLIIDLASTNGVMLDERQVVGRQPLLSGQRIGLGDTIIHIDAVDSDSQNRAADFDEERRQSDTAVDFRPDSGLSHFTGALSRREDESRGQATPLRGPGRQQAADSGQHEMASLLPLTGPLEAKRTPYRSPTEAETEDSGVYGMILGRRVGPLAKAEFETLRQRAERGELGPADLEELLAPDTGRHPPAAFGS